LRDHLVLVRSRILTDAYARYGATPNFVRPAFAAPEPKP
jgi:hypothetical protein